MNLIHEGSEGFWVATAEEAAKYLGYEPGHFGSGFMVGRWLGVSTNLGTFSSVEAAIAAEPDVLNRTVERSNPSNALDLHLSNLKNNN